jgi:hypothetical protein
MTTHRTTATQGRSAIVVFALSALLPLLAPSALPAQVAVFPVQNLSFGTIRAGMPEYVAPDDVARRAELELVGSGRVVITIALPTEMVSAGGHHVPLLFDHGDATFADRGGGKERSFDPNKSANFNIKASDGGGTICLGGMALPDASQPPGRYTATITVQVVTPGT